MENILHPKFTRKGKILAVILAVCLSILSISPLKFESIAFTNKEKTPFQKELSSLSREENQRLKELFDHHFFFSDFAYTLFGTKPMSIGRFYPTQNIKKGWEAWKKINGSFASKKFIIRKYTCNDREFTLYWTKKQDENDRRSAGMIHRIN